MTRHQELRCRDFGGMLDSTEPGMLAPARVRLLVTQEASPAFEGARISLTVQVGQALPGAIISLRQGDTLLDEAPLTGMYGNEAEFEVNVGREVCSRGRCSLDLTLSAEDLDSPVPVPVLLHGTAVVLLNGKSEELHFDSSPFSVEVSDAS